MEPSVISGEQGIFVTIISAVIWMAVAIALGLWGKSRKVGFWPAFLVALLMPLISIIIILVFGPKEEEETPETAIAEAIEKYQQAKLNSDQAILTQFENATNNMSLSQKLEQLKQMKADGLLNDQDYNRMKTNLLTGK